MIFKYVIVISIIIYLIIILIWVNVIYNKKIGFSIKIQNADKCLYVDKNNIINFSEKCDDKNAKFKFTHDKKYPSIKHINTDLCLYNDKKKEGIVLGECDVENSVFEFDPNSNDNNSEYFFIKHIASNKCVGFTNGIEDKLNPGKIIPNNLSNIYLRKCIDANDYKNMSREEYNNILERNRFKQYNK